MKKIFLIYLSFVGFVSLAHAQERDSLVLMNQLNSFEVKNTASLSQFYTLAYSAIEFLPDEYLKPKMQKGYELSIEYGADSLTCAFAFEIANIIYSKKVNDDALLEYLEVGLAMAQENSFKFFEGWFNNIYGLHYSQIANDLKAVEYFHEGLTAFKEGDELEMISFPLGELASIYEKIGEEEMAIKYRKEAVFYGNMLPYPSKPLGNAYEYQAIAISYDKLGQIDSAYFYFERNEEAIAMIDTLQGAYYDILKVVSYDSKIEFLLKNDKPERVPILIDKLKKINQNYYTLGSLRYYLYQNEAEKIRENIAFFEQDLSLKTAESPAYLDLKVKCYAAIGEYKKALEVSQFMNSLEKSSQKEKRDNYSLYMDAHFENTKKEERIEVLKIENQLKQTQTWFLRVGLFATLILAGFIFYLFRQIKQHNRLLKKDLDSKKLIEEQSKELRRNYESKNRMFGNIAHELRTPLTLISGPINRLLEQTELTEEDRNQVELAADNSDRLLEMTNQILSLVKSEVGLVKTTNFTFYWKDLLEYLQFQFQSLVKNRDLQLIFPQKINKDLISVTDVEKLMTIIKNLLFNAIKYSRIGGQIELSYATEGEEMMVTISDNGPGVSEEDLPHLFNRYYQVSDNKKSKGGIGIGLAICREYLKIIGGSISVESKVGIGSRFTIKFPMQQMSPENTTAYQFPNYSKPKIIELPQITQKQIIDKNYVLIVEDNLDLCNYMYSVLKGDYNLSFAYNGVQALEQIAIKAPDLIITDWMMPELDGKELVETLKNNPIYAAIPVLMLTARSMKRDELDMLIVGVDGYLTKPFKDEELLAYLNYLSNLSEERIAYVSVELEEMKSNVEQNLAPLLSKNDQIMLVNFESYVLRNIGDFSLNLEQIAKSLDMSLRHLHRKIKKLTGLSPNQYVQEIRFTEAKRMLEEREHLSVKAVTYSVGFKAEKNFSRNFKKRFGKYPKDFLEG